MGSAGCGQWVIVLPELSAAEASSGPLARSRTDSPRDGEETGDVLSFFKRLWSGRTEPQVRTQ